MRKGDRRGSRGWSQRTVFTKTGGFKRKITCLCCKQRVVVNNLNRSYCEKCRPAKEE